MKVQRFFLFIALILGLTSFMGLATADQRPEMVNNINTSPTLTSTPLDHYQYLPLVLNNSAPSPPATPTPIPSNTPTATPTSAPSNLIVNGGFENRTAWFIPMLGGSYLMAYPHSGSYSMLVCNTYDSFADCNPSFYQSVKVPQNVASLQISFYWRGMFYRANSTNKVYVKIYDDTQTYFTGDRLLYDGAGYKRYSWVLNSATVVNLRNKTVKVGFFDDRFFTVQTEYLIDDVELIAVYGEWVSPTPTPTPTPTPGGPTPTPPPCGIGNCDFEQGATIWTEYSQNGWPLIMHADDLPISAHSGSWAAWLGGDDNEIAYLQQSVFVPADRPYLGYWHWIYSYDDCGYDFAYIRINDNTVYQYDLCSSNSTNGWVLHVVNLSAYAGQTVQLQVRVKTDSSVISSLFLDDFAFQSTGN